jgi:lipopolysaccharide/colanic/teichoic acid biosynthesis glycosyltransferase
LLAAARVVMIDLGTLKGVAPRAAAGSAPPGPPTRVVGSWAKRSLDIIVSGLLILALWPVWLVVAILIRREDNGPVLFHQQRVGLGGRHFEMLKFRSMRVGGDDSALRELVEDALSGQRAQATNGSFKLEADPRITRVGRVLRATSLDELPQLFNVLRGEMSLVGPRPALQWEMERFPPKFHRRTHVPPGMTGLWQVSGRSRVDTVRMLQYDLEYVDRSSFWLDVSILCRTIPTVVRGDGAR